jgi:glycosyltransferase involved in cell wall biosynthesis
MSNPKISVIMPVFNGEAYVHHAIESILQQTFNDFEFIVINDGSTDKSGSIISSYSDSRIKLLFNPVNLGLVYSLNYGIENSRGEYIARMDADDISLPERLKIQVEFLEANPSYGMCGTFYQVIDIHGKRHHKVDLPETDRDIRTFLNFGNCFCHSTVMFRADLTKKYKYEQQYFLIEDYKLWYSFSRSGRISILPFYTIYYRMHDSNISAVKKNQMHLMLQEMNEIILRDLHIDYSDGELLIHTNFLVFNYQFFQANPHIKELESWILKMYAVMKNDERFNPNIIAKIFLRRWFVICFKTKNFYHIFFSPLFLRFKLNYLKYFAEKISDSYFKRNLGIDY